MSTKKISEQLEKIATAVDFPDQSSTLTERWENTSADNIDTVEAILRFIEGHPFIDFGAPGALVHFVERYYGKGYEEKLLDSVRRKPTPHTVMMINALINGTHAPEARRALISALEQAGANPLADVDTQNSVNLFLQRFSTI